MKLDLIVNKCAFTNDKGEKIEFYALSTQVDGEKIDLQVKDSSKKIFKYLLKFHKFDDKGGLID